MVYVTLAGTHYIDQASLELTEVFLPLPPGKFLTFGMQWCFISRRLTGELVAQHCVVEEAVFGTPILLFSPRCISLHLTSPQQGFFPRYMPYLLLLHGFNSHVFLKLLSADTVACLRFAIFVRLFYRTGFGARFSGGVCVWWGAVWSQLPLV